MSDKDNLTNKAGLASPALLLGAVAITFTIRNCLIAKMCLTLALFTKIMLD